MNLPNCSDQIAFEDMFKEVKDQKAQVNILTLMCILSDLYYLMGKCEALEEGIEYYKKQLESYERG